MTILSGALWGGLGNVPMSTGPLGRVILVKAGGLGLHDPHMVKPLIVLYPVWKILFHSGQIVAVMSPFILPLAVLIIVTSPCDIGGWSQDDAPAQPLPFSSITAFKME